MLRDEQAVALAGWMLGVLEGARRLVEDGPTSERADLAAKREIAAMLLDACRSRSADRWVLAEVVQLLARAYTDVPGYRSEWCPQLAPTGA